MLGLNFSSPINKTKSNSRITQTMSVGNINEFKEMDLILH